ncbi:unnamed protein product [Chrysoparadoxa australica]
MWMGQSIVAAALICLFQSLLTPTCNASPWASNKAAAAKAGETSGRSAYPEFSKALDELYPGALPEGEFAEKLSASLKAKNFHKDNSITCVGACRDEISGSLVEEISKKQGPVFGFRGLAGFMLCGKTGFGAAHAHSPVDRKGKRRYVYVVTTHIGIGKDGQAGVCYRGEKGTSSGACGALCAVQAELKGGHINTELDVDDMEISVIKQLMTPKVAWGDQPDLSTLTKLALEVIVQQQLERIIAATVDTKKADYAVIAGIQVHGPEEKGPSSNYVWVWPKACYTVVNGRRSTLKL